MKLLIRLLLLSVALAIKPIGLHAQATIKGPDYVCLGDLANFKVVSVGKTVKSVSWDFGDGHTSTFQTVSYLYSKSGRMTVSLSVTYNDNTTSTSQQDIDVFALPVSSFLPEKPNGIYCSHNAHVCFSNKSQPSDPSRPLQKMIVTWGDGNLDVEKGTPPANYCHDFETMGDFKIRFEIVDSKGCKNTDYQKITVVEGVGLTLSSEKTLACNSTTYCVKLKAEPANSTWQWIMNGNNITSRGDYYCDKFFTATNVNLVAYGENPKTKCRDTVILNEKVTVLAETAKLTLNKHHFCFNDTLIAASVFVSAAPKKVKWKLDGKTTTDSTIAIYISGKDKKLMPGLHKLECSFQIGPCSMYFSDTFRISGPVAKMGIWNDGQCFSNETVFFVDSTMYKGEHCGLTWDAGDDDFCTIWRAKNQNRNTNCRYTKDWWGKHNYPYNTLTTVTLTATDSVTGCSDKTEQTVYVGDCITVLDMKHVNLCQGDSFLPLKPYYYNPIKYSMDSGKTWLRFPGRLDTNLIGDYDVWFISPHNFPTVAKNYGDDSFTLISVPVTFDTFVKPGFATIVEKPKLKTFSATATGCKSCRIKLVLGAHKFKPDENLFVSWKDSTWRYFFDRDTIPDTLIFHSELSGGDSLRIRYFNAFGCENKYALYVGCGMTLDILHDSTDCYGNNHCVNLTVKNNASDTFYNLPDSAFKLSLWWDKKLIQNKTMWCDTVFNLQGNKLTFICSDPYGCTDTLQDSIYVQKVVAGVMPDSKLAFCSELKQLFDSSYALGGNNLIKYYGWQFNRSTRYSQLKDPVQMFEKGGKNHVVHWVESSYGCKDTMEYDVEIAGSDPFFSIPDTMGCASFKAVFKNHSKNCKTYLWDFGDPSGSIFSNSDTSDVEFTYTIPGTYHIKLTGIDTIYSPITGEAYHCHSDYPGLLQENRSVVVLPYYKSGILAPDTVCENEKFVVVSQTDFAAGYDRWTMPDNTRPKYPVKQMIPQQLTRGIYTYSLRPDYDYNPGDPYCADTPSHTVVVLGIDADFSFLSKQNDGNFDFTNLSSKEAVRFEWNFGHPQSGNKNFSKDKDPSHDYYPDTGQFKVCLTAYNSHGCKDTVCKMVSQDYMEYLYLANVFTPSETDMKNDYFDVIIAGEKVYELKIFNRWGEVVFHSTTDADRFRDNLNWNGKVKNTGAVCPEGTYFYQFSYSFRRSPEKVRLISGSVNLIR